jgi:hypothetical protein
MTEPSKKSQGEPGYWRGFENFMLLGIGVIEPSELTDEELAEVAFAGADAARNRQEELGFEVRGAERGCRYFVAMQKSRFYLAKNETCDAPSVGDTGYAALSRSSFGTTEVELEGHRREVSNISSITIGVSTPQALDNAC